MDAVDLIAQAVFELDFDARLECRIAPDYSPRERLLVGAMECFYGNGAGDEQAGDTETTGHIFRVDRFTLITGSSGHVSFMEHETVEEAEQSVATISALEEGEDA